MADKPQTTKDPLQALVEETERLGLYDKPKTTIISHSDDCNCMYCERDRQTLANCKTTPPDPVDLEIAYRNALYIRDNVIHTMARARSAESVAALARFEPKLEARYGR